MSAKRIVFSAERDTPPVATILPCLEALLSVRLGDDPDEVWDFWEKLIEENHAKTRYVFDNRPNVGTFQPAGDQHHNAIRYAFEVACLGVTNERNVDWATMAFLDVASADELPEYSCSCSLGWVTSPGDPRGISVRITMAPSSPWEKLVLIGQELAINWPGQWRWMTIGYRFVSMPWHSRLFAESISVIQARSKRFRAVDISDHFGLLTSFWQDQLRTVSWVTLVSAHLLKKLGGTQQVLSACRPPIEVVKLGESLLLRAGELPILCDINRREDASVYQAVDNILKPIRASEAVRLPPWDMESTRLWLERWNTRT